LKRSTSESGNLAFDDLALGDDAPKRFNTFHQKRFKPLEDQNVVAPAIGQELNFT